ncbi:hypothetical protein [Mycobacteroides abscessus]|uniref:hypothetical protein n=1 Tax=Mycobacteroides abscessus TaxID=36809 RepID=UPI0019D04325|nr:hypothetical protein [Mycobacteroides abscessus]MBN7458004.1 hypothetical protein [Mycobacteroides abscessus subsp. abscessus]
MALDTRPDPGRRAESPTWIAKNVPTAPSRDPRKIRELLRTEQLQGWVKYGAERPRFYAYLDQFQTDDDNPDIAVNVADAPPADEEHVPASVVTRMQTQIDELRRQLLAVRATDAQLSEARDEIAALKAKLATANETNRLLVAADASLMDTVKKSRKISAKYRALAEESEEVNDDLHGVASHYREVVAQLIAPSHPQDL